MTHTTLARPATFPDSRSRRSRILGLAIILVSLAGLFGPSLIAHAKHAADPMWFNDDCRAYIWPMLRYHDPSLFHNDYLAQFFLDAMPIGYKFLYWTWSRVADTRSLSKVLPYLLLPVFLASVWITVCRLANTVAAWAAVALCLSSTYFLWRLTGGLPRAFGAVIIGVAAMSLTLGRPILLAAVTCLGAALYPVVGLVSGIVLAAYLLLFPAVERKGTEHWSVRRRLLVVGITAILSAGLVLPTLLRTHTYGSLIRPGEISTYPEAGPGGRYEPKDLPPYKGFGAEAWNLIRQTLVAKIGPLEARPWPYVTGWMRGQDYAAGPAVQTLLIATVCLGIIGSAMLAFGDPAARRLLLLLFAALIGHVIALAVAPALYVPARYADYPIPVLAVILIPAGAWALGGFLARRLRWPCGQTVFVVTICLVCLLGLGSRGHPTNGFSVQIPKNDTIYPFLASLPGDAMIAGWPYGLLDSVPYLSKRRTLMTYETHAVLHEKFVMEMRRRMTALLAAYYATDLTPLNQLRDQFGVTHLVVNLNYYEVPPWYFKPFARNTLEAFRASRSGGIEVKRHLEQAIHREGDFAVLDLHLLKEP